MTPRDLWTQMRTVGFGTASIGNLYREVSDENAHGSLQAAWDGGIRYFDTAPHYGLGLAERRLGEFLAGHPREEYLVSTKVGRLLEPNPDYTPGDRDLADAYDVEATSRRRWDASAEGIRRSLEESLERLGLDHVDILYLHDPDVYDVDSALRTGIPALIDLREEGLVRAIGVGTNSDDAAATILAEYPIDLVMMAGRYTLLEQPAASTVLPGLNAREARMVAVGIFNSGLLARAEVPEDTTYNYESAPEALLAKARELASICRDFGTELPTAALQFPLRQPLVSSIVLGASKPGHVRENLERLGAPIPAALWAELASRGLIPRNMG